MAGTITTYTGSGVIESSDYKVAKWVGKTKDGKAVTIQLSKAINLGNIDWQFAEKDDVVAEIVMTGVYSNTNSAASDAKEPWLLAIDGTPTAGAGEIMLGAGVFYVGGQAVALTRGGGKFTVEREFREINADGDRGPVEGRINQEGARCTLTLNALTILTNLTSLYTGIITTTATQ